MTYERNLNLYLDRTFIIQYSFKLALILFLMTRDKCKLMSNQFFKKWSSEVEDCKYCPH